MWYLLKIQSDKVKNILPVSPGVLILLFLITLIFIGGCSKKETGINKETVSSPEKQVINLPTQWFKFRGDARNTGSNSRVEGPLQPQLKIKFKARHEIMSSPVMSPDGYIFVTSHDGILYRLNSSTGKVKEVFKSVETIISSPLILNNKIYFGGFDEFFYCVDSKGKLIFKFKTDSWIASSPSMTSDGKIVFASNDGFLYAINESGNLLWKYEIGKQDYEIHSSPAIFGENIIIGSGTGFIYTLNSQGKLLWKYDTGSPVYASPAIDEKGNIHVGSEDGTVYCLDSKGKLLWQNKNGEKITSSCTITAGEKVALGTRGGSVLCFDKKGKLLWKHTGEKSIESSPCSDKNGNIFIGTDGGTVICLNSTGKLLWEYKTGKPVLSSPALDEKGNMVFGCEDKYLYIIGDE